jgi:hypothetical protein
VENARLGCTVPNGYMHALMHPVLATRMAAQSGHERPGGSIALKSALTCVLTSELASVLGIVLSTNRQDKTIKKVVEKTPAQAAPWVTFTCGPMGAGKGYALQWCVSHLAVRVGLVHNSVHDRGLFPNTILLSNWQGACCKDYFSLLIFQVYSILSVEYNCTIDI